MRILGAIILALSLPATLRAASYTGDFNAFGIIASGTMTATHMVSVASATASGLTIKNGTIAISSSPFGTSQFLIQKSGANESTLTNSNASGFLRIMPGKANPQIILGDNTTSGSIFFDSSSGRPMFINTLSTATVNINRLTMTATSTMTITTNMTITGTGAPPVGFALCLDSTGKLGHCTSVVGAGGGCTCSAP